MTDSIITPELRDWIGRKTPLRELEIISAADVRRYVDATGDANPLWLDDDFARAAGYRGRLLPGRLWSAGCRSVSKKAPNGRIAIRPICAANCRCLVNIPTCATPALKPSGPSLLILAISFRLRARSSTSSPVKERRA